MQRLATHLWVSAYLHRLTQEGVYALVRHKGDATAGAVAVKLSFMDGEASLFTRAWGEADRLVWVAEHDRGAEETVDETVARMRARDRDLWVVEVEDPRGRHFLDDPAFAH
jgi:hypothetical protein